MSNTSKDMRPEISTVGYINDYAAIKEIVADALSESSYKDLLLIKMDVYNEKQKLKKEKTNQEKSKDLKTANDSEAVYKVSTYVRYIFCWVLIILVIIVFTYFAFFPSAFEKAKMIDEWKEMARFSFKLIGYSLIPGLLLWVNMEAYDIEPYHSLINATDKNSYFEQNKDKKSEDSESSKAEILGRISKDEMKYINLMLDRKIYDKKIYKCQKISGQYFVTEDDKAFNVTKYIRSETDDPLLKEYYKLRMQFEYIVDGESHLSLISTKYIEQITPENSAKLLETESPIDQNDFSAERLLHQITQVLFGQR